MTEGQIKNEVGIGHKIEHKKVTIKFQKTYCEPYKFIALKDDVVRSI